MVMIKRKVRETSFGNDQAWLSIEDEEGNYLGTWHIVNRELVNTLKQQERAPELRFVLSEIVKISRSK